MKLTRHPPDATGHPSYHCYRSHNCRCVGCVNAQRVVRARYHAKIRAARQYPMPTTIARLYREIGIIIHPKVRRR